MELSTTRFAKWVISFVVCIGAWGFSSVQVQAQEIEDTWGREFFFAFPPNFHNQPQQYEDSLFIFVSSQERASFELTYSGRFMSNGQERYQEFTVTGVVEPNTTFVVDIPFRTLAPGAFTPSDNDMFFELEGYKMQGLFQEPSPRRQNADIAKQVFHLTSDAEVSVYALNQSRTTSDAMVVLPVDILGTEYGILTYNSDGREFSDNTPSQFAVVATEDNTTINFALSAPAQDEFGTDFSIELQRGEAYLVQCARTDILNSPDMSGSFVNADKPIAVFAGHQRAVLPLSQNGASRDMLLEQVPPITSLGLYYFVSPFPVPQGVSSSSGDIYRVLATANNTELIIDRVDTIDLQQGEVYEASLTRAHELVSSRPVLVATYKKTSRLDNIGNEFGDPFMMFIPPVEQFMRRYQVTNAITFEQNFNDWQEVYGQQYVMLTLPTESIQQTTVDGISVDFRDFTAIGTSGYSYGVVQVVGGVHNVVSDTVFGINIFGYGGANSYGYVGGMQFREIYGPSLILDSTADCFAISGEVVDTLSLDIDTPVQWVEFPEEFLVNVTVEQPVVTEPTDTVAFTASLVDPYRDGSVRVISANVFEHRLESDFTIPGFDVHVDPQLRGVEVVHVEEPSWFGQEVEYQFDLTNSSSYDQLVENLFLKDNVDGLELLTIGTPLPVVLQPGESIVVPVRFRAVDAGEFIDTLCVQGPCIERPLVAFTQRVRRDDNPPISNVESDSCASEVVVTFEDAGLNEHGIASWEILSTLNCEIAIDESQLPERLQMVIGKIDSLDAIGYEVSITDSSGNVIVVSDTLTAVGLALSANTPFAYTVNTLSGKLVCGYVTVHNITEVGTEVTNAQLNEFIEFAYPLSQLPLYVPAQDSAQFEVCFRSEDIGTFRDILSLGAGCLRSSIELIGVVDPIVGEGTSRCKVVLAGEQISTQTLVLEQPYPNPAHSHVDAVIHVPHDTDIEYQIVTMNGEKIDSGRILGAGAGSYAVTLSVEDLSDGLYMVVVTDGIQVVQRKITVVR